MLKNNFTNAPTVGSHDYNSTIDEMNARIARLEQRVTDTERQLASKPEKKKSGFGWKKLLKAVAIIAAAITPIFALVPKMLNAMSRYRTAFA